MLPAPGAADVLTAGDSSVWLGAPPVAGVAPSSFTLGGDVIDLANLPEIPDETSVNEYKLTELAELFTALQDNKPELRRALHRRAQQLLADGQSVEAFRTLLTFNDR